MARDKFHFQVKEALIKEGWTITHDPYYLKIGRKEIYIDIGTERLLAAEKGNEKIAVEVKSFPHLSFLADFYEAVGKFLTYENALMKKEPERHLFLAVPHYIYNEEMDQEELIQAVIQTREIHIVVVDVEQKNIIQWIK